MIFKDKPNNAKHTKPHPVPQWRYVPPPPGKFSDMLTTPLLIYHF